MAAFDCKPAQKPHVYDLLGQLNAAFARVTGKLSALEQTGVFDRRTIFRLYRLSKELPFADGLATSASIPPIVTLRLRYEPSRQPLLHVYHRLIFLRRAAQPADGVKT